MGGGVDRPDTPYGSASAFPFRLQERSAGLFLPSFIVLTFPFSCRPPRPPAFVLQHEGSRRSTDKHKFAHAGVLTAHVHSLMAL